MPSSFKVSSAWAISRILPSASGKGIAANIPKRSEKSFAILAPNSLHSPLFYPDIEETLTMGIPAMVACVTDLLPKQ